MGRHHRSLQTAGNQPLELVSVPYGGCAATWPALSPQWPQWLRAVGVEPTGGEAHLAGLLLGLIAASSAALVHCSMGQVQAGVARHHQQDSTRH